MDRRRLIAIDPSLTCSGWALFDICNKKLLGVGKILAKSASFGLAERIADLQRRVADLFASVDLRPPDVLICEAPTTMRDPRAAITVEQVRGIFETVARSSGVEVPGRLNPRSVQFEVMGLRGKQLQRSVVKASAIHAARALYGSELEEIGFSSSEMHLAKNQDIVDALLIGSLALTRLEEARISGRALGDLFRIRTSGRSRARVSSQNIRMG